MKDPAFHLVFAEPFSDTAMARARSFGRVTVLERPECLEQAAALRDADALLVRTYAKVTDGVITAGPRLRVIGRAGVGLENVDLAAARARDITVVYTPGAATEAVADLTVGLMISVIRGLTRGDALVRAGRFAEGRSNCVGVELSEMTLGVIGLGRIGKAVARRCAGGFGMRVSYHDIVAMPALDFEATPVELDRLYGDSDVISLHVPLTQATGRMIDDTALSRMKRGAWLINTARGGVVDHDALAAALADGRLAGAALDVTDPEPLPPGHPLLTMPSVVIAPHIGARTYGGLERMNDVIDDVIGVLSGRPPQHPAPKDGSRA